MFLDVQKDLIIWLQSFHNAFTDFFFNLVSFFGEPEFYIILLGFIYWVFNKKAGEFLGITLGISISLNNLLKAVFMIERPFLTHDEIDNFREYTATGSAFPSGHAQGNTTVFYALARYFNRRYLWITAIVMMVLMMLSRMFLGVHYLQDVLVGSAIGFGLALGVHYLFRRYETSWLRLYLIFAALFLPAFFLVDVNDFFRGYGILIGFILAMWLEKNYVNFTMEIPLYKKVIRYVLGVVLMILTMSVLGMMFGFAEDGTTLKNMLDFVRFFFVAFIGFGVYPMIFKKFNF